MLRAPPFSSVKIRLRGRLRRPPPASPFLVSLPLTCTVLTSKSRAPRQASPGAQDQRLAGMRRRLNVDALLVADVVRCGEQLAEVIGLAG